MEEKKCGTNVSIVGNRCYRCGHEWIPRKKDKARLCPHCNSPYFDVPKKVK